MLNVMPDLASAMKYNPGLKVSLMGYDLATPYFKAGTRIPAGRGQPAGQHRVPLLSRLGHMVYAQDASAKLLHDDVAGFITKNSRR